MLRLRCGPRYPRSHRAASSTCWSSPACTRIAGLGVTFLLGQCGIVSLAQSVFYGIGAYSTAYCTTHYGWPAPAGFALGIGRQRGDRGGRRLAGAASVRLFPGARDVGAGHHRTRAVHRVGLAHRRHARHRRHSAARSVRLRAEHAAALLLPGVAARRAAAASAPQSAAFAHRFRHARDARRARRRRGAGRGHSCCSRSRSSC